jgi:hypothetical protein
MLTELLSKERKYCDALPVRNGVKGRYNGIENDINTNVKVITGLWKYSIRISSSDIF